MEKYHQARQRQLESSQKAQEKDKGKGKGAVSTTESTKSDSAAADPLVHLLGALIHFWKKKFIINAPGLRKNGYSSMTELAQILSAQGGLQEGEAGMEGLTSERIENLRAYREMARKLEGSRDVGAQFFTALLRALGFETRMVFSLQPLGFRFHAREGVNRNGNITQAPMESLLGERDASGGGRKKKRGPEHSKKPTRKRRKASTPESDAEQSEISEDEGPDSQSEEDEPMISKYKCVFKLTGHMLIS